MLSSLYSTQKVDDNPGISFQGLRLMPDKPDDNQGHVDPKSRNLITGESYLVGN